MAGLSWSFALRFGSYTPSIYSLKYGLNLKLTLTMAEK